MDGEVRVSDRRPGHRRGEATRQWRPRLPWALALALLLPLAAPTVVSAQSARSLVEEGNRLYEEGRFQEAHQRYMEAMTDAPDSPVIPFNAGNALYQDADYRRAMEAYEQAIASGDPALASDAWYNLGNALYRQQQLQPSLEAYKQALRLDPSDVDAKHNLERVLQQMQEQQQQQQQQQQDSPQDGEEGEQQQGQPQPGQEEGQGQAGQEPGEGEQDEQDGQGGQQQEEGQDESPEGSEAPEGGEGGEDQPSRGDTPQDGEGSGGEGQPQPAEMTEEEARRLLAAIDEDPGEVGRKPPAATGRRPSKPW